jgi:tetratricopeptide (TPR) repeat protein
MLQEYWNIYNYKKYLNTSLVDILMEICEKYLEDARKALKGSMFSKPDPTEAIRSFEGAAQCFENYKDFERAAQCYLDTVNFIINSDPLKAAELMERAARCTEKEGGDAHEYHLKSANIYRDHAITLYRTNPEQGLQLLQKAAENFEKGGDRETAIQCYEVGAEASMKRKDYLNALVFYGTAAQHFERRNQYKQAVKYYHKVAKLWDVQDVPENVAENYLRMAFCLRTLKEYEYSSEFFKKAAKKYKEARKMFDASKSFQEAAKTYESQGDIKNAALIYEKAAEITKALKNNDKYEELVEKSAECYSESGNTKKAVDLHLLLVDTFIDDQYRSNKHFEAAISHAEYDPSLKISLLKQQGETLLQSHDYFNAAKCFVQAAETTEQLGESPTELYKKAGDVSVKYAESMLKVRNQPRSKEGFSQAAEYYEKAGMPEEIEKIKKLSASGSEQRRSQILKELERLREDMQKGYLPSPTYNQMKEGYQELLRRLKK